MTTLPITPVALPAGYRARPAAADDAERIAALLNGYIEPLVQSSWHTVEEIRSRFVSPGFDPTTSTRLVEGPDGAAAGCMMVFDTDTPPVHPYINGAVAAEHLRRGIGSFLVTWALERSQQAIPRVPDGIRVAPHAWIIHTHEPTRLLYERLGFAPIAYSFIMNISLAEEPPAPVWPEGITVRTYREQPDLRRVFMAVEAIFRDHRGYVESEPEEQIAQWQHYLDANVHFDPDLWFLTMAGDEIVGLSLCEPNVGDNMTLGLVDTLGVTREWRRHGLGLALLQHSFHELRRRGKNHATLSVDAQSLTGATRLYERAGMHVHRRMATYEREVRPGVEISVQAL